MEYLYESRKENYEDFSSGRVLYSAAGTTSFPVRLAGEIIQRCFEVLSGKGNPGPYSVYDPCAGSAYLLTVIGLLHGRRIKEIFASDINPQVLQIARRNLSLLSMDGMNERKQQLRTLFDLYHKESHSMALQSVNRLSHRGFSRE